MVLGHWLLLLLVAVLAACSGSRGCRRWWGGSLQGLLLLDVLLLLQSWVNASCGGGCGLTTEHIWWSSVCVDVCG